MKPAIFIFVAPGDKHPKLQMRCRVRCTLFISGADANRCFNFHNFYTHGNVLHHLKFSNLFSNFLRWRRETILAGRGGFGFPFFETSRRGGRSR
jgi:hypothetical protein